ncbi:MAG: response regulator [Alphaproteobacteria bacterium]
MRTLIVEDNAVIGTAIADALSKNYEAVDWAQNISVARDFFASYEYDVVVLDLNLPDGNGLSLLPLFSSSMRTPAILILTAQDSLTDRVVGLDAGADDYLVKPFEMEELMARIRVLARRQNGRVAGATFKFGDLTLDPKSHTVTLSGSDVTLARREFAGLKLFMEKAELVVTKDDLINQVYDTSDPPLENAVEVLISRIRKKISGSRVALKTVRGVGYMLLTED